jgi:hypothetical protein
MTAQIHERLIFDGEETSMACCPPLPEGHPRIVEASGEEREDRSDFLLGSTACWRGYEGTWEIRDGRFYLVGLRGRYRLTGGEPLFADWFTGFLRIPRGKMLHYVHMGFASVYEGETHVLIERGMLRNVREIAHGPETKNPDAWPDPPGMS